MNGAKLIINKELARVFKDKKMVFSLFILPAVLVIVIYGIMGQMMTAMTEDVQEHVSTVYIQNAPEELEAVIARSGFGAISNVKYLDDSADVDKIKNDILAEDTDLLVIFERDFTQKVNNYQNAGDAIPGVTLCYNSTLDYSSAAKNNFEHMVLADFETQLLGQRFGNLELLTVFSTNEELHQKEEKAQGEFMSMMLPYLIVMMLFAGAMSLGVDAIAGEKERGTMASMLLTPVSRRDIVVGKLVSLSIMSGLSAVVYAVAMVIAIPMFGSSLGEGASMMAVNFSVLQIVQLLLTMVFLVYLYVAVISLLAVLAKDSKEAGTYISPLYIVVILAGMITMFTRSSSKTIIDYAIPVYGNALAIKDLIVNELTFQNFLASIGGVVLVSVIVTALITRAFNSEKVMFNA